MRSMYEPSAKVQRSSHFSNLVNVDTQCIADGDLHRVWDITRATLQDQRRFIRQPSCQGMSLVMTGEDKRWAEQATQELQEAERRRAEATGRRQVHGRDYMDRPPDPGAASSSDPEGSATPSNQQGPDQNPRTRHTWPDTGVGPEEALDWTALGIGRPVPVLKLL